jgi:hypothetical protein
MSKAKNKTADADVQKVLKALHLYQSAHQNAEVSAYRYNQASIRIRVVDPDLKTLDRIERDEFVWKYLEKLPENIVSQITMLVLLAPGEETKSGSNLEFNRPSPATL